MCSGLVSAVWDRYELVPDRGDIQACPRSSNSCLTLVWEDYAYSPRDDSWHGVLVESKAWHLRDPDLFAVANRAADRAQHEVSPRGFGHCLPRSTDMGSPISRGSIVGATGMISWSDLLASMAPVPQ